MDNIQEERYLGRIGTNLQKIIELMMENQNLLRYLKYTDKDPLDKNKPDLYGPDLYEQQIMITPVIGTNDNSTSRVSLKILKGIINSKNTEFIEVYFTIEIFVPITQWKLKSKNLRPYLIMGEIMRSLEKKRIEGLGEIVADSFQVQFFTEEMSCYEMVLHFTQYK